LFFTGADGTDFIQAASIAAQVDGTPGTNDMPGRLVFSTTADGASTPTERLRITSAGNVGIGTSSPAHVLDVSGDTRLNGVVGARIAPSSAASLSVGQGGSNFTLGTDYALFISGSGYSGGIALNATSMQIGQNSASRSLTFHSGTSFAERMRIDSSGNLGLGVVPSASTVRALQVPSDTVVGSQGTGLNITTNAYFDGSWKYHATGAATWYQQSSGAHAWWTAPSGTAGNAITFTLAMTLNSSGSLLVTNAAGLGYGTGAGGTVTQATNKSTAVTLNKPTGAITMNNAALAAGASVVFNVNNSVFAIADTVIVTPSANGNYRLEPASSNTGVFSIRVTNVTGGSLSEALVINFAIIKGATS
jgi:hypothetical protein